MAGNSYEQKGPANAFPMTLLVSQTALIMKSGPGPFSCQLQSMINLTFLKRMNHMIEHKECIMEENNLIMALMMNSVDASIAATITFYTCVKNMWTFLRETYSHDKNITKNFQLEENLFQLRQGIWIFQNVMPL